MTSFVASGFCGWAAAMVVWLGFLVCSLKGVEGFSLGLVFIYEKAYLLLGIVMHASNCSPQ